MVLKILNSGQTSKAALNYNFGKVDKNVAEVVFCANMSTSPHVATAPEQYVRELFLDYEQNTSVHPHTRNFVFHLAISPGESDNMTEAKMIEFIKEYMQEMGFGSQPYILYRHNDIIREHYHLITPLVNADGKVVFLRRRREILHDPKDRHNWSRHTTLNIALKLAPKFGFTVGKGTGKAEGVDIKVAQPSEIVVSKGEFAPNAPNVLINMAYLFKDALKYNFRSESELKDILLSMGLKMNVIRGVDEQHSKLTLQGIDRSGTPTSRVFEMTRSLGRNPLTMFTSRLGENSRRSRENMDSGAWTKLDGKDFSEFPFENIGNVVAMQVILQECFRQCQSTEEFIERARELGFKLILNRGVPDKFYPLGPIDGITVIHPASHTVVPPRLFRELILNPDILRRRETDTTWNIRIPEKRTEPFFTPEEKRRVLDMGHKRVALFNSFQDEHNARRPKGMFAGYTPAEKTNKGYGF